MRLRVRQARAEDVYKDLVRIPEIHRTDSKGIKIPEGTVCKLTVTASKSKLVCMRGCGDEQAPLILMDEKTRDDLMVTDGKEYAFELDRASWIGHCRWACAASDPAYRIPAQLGLFSLALGAVGLVLGLLSLIPK
jgi:hypothetical protein